MTNTKEQKSTQCVSDDELVARILKALSEHYMSHDQIMALGDSPRHTAVVLESLIAIGKVEDSCEAIRPSTCRYKLVGEG